jgi:murein hydrolase activator
MSLYGYNETLLKRVGDEIHGGNTIARVGNSGGSENSGLYFELRHQGKPFDPLGWVRRR